MRQKVYTGNYQGKTSLKMIYSILSKGAIIKVFVRDINQYKKDCGLIKYKHGKRKK